jgi:hypothetical protein
MHNFWSGNALMDLFSSCWTFFNWYRLLMAQQSSSFSLAPLLVSHTVSRLPNDNTAARFPDAADFFAIGLDPTRCGCSSAQRYWPPYSLTAYFTSSRARRPALVLVLSSLLHPLAFLPCLHEGKVDLSGHLYGEVFLDYEILYDQVSLNNELHIGGVASLATSSSIVVGLLHKQA